MKKHFKNYSSIIWLLTGILTGSIAGLVLGKKAEIIKPVGDIFLNLLFTAVIPLVFFAISSAIAALQPSDKLGRLLGLTSLVFLATVLIAAFLAIAAVKLFPVNEHLAAGATSLTEKGGSKSLGNQITQLFTVEEFYELFSRKSMLAMIVISLLVGIATLRSGEKGAAFAAFLHAGNEVFKNVFIVIMKLGPIGLGAYFSYQVGVFGPQLFGTYASSLGLYYGLGAFYFVVAFSLYAFIAGGGAGIKKYWENNLIPSATAIGTCSSIAVIPANLQAARKIGISEVIANIAIPLGALLHKEGSSISSIIKMALVFALFGRNFNGPETLLLAVALTVLVSMVEGGIPNGGYVGELLFISIYGLPIEALAAAMVIGTLVDPMATLLNATGDTVAAMLIARFTMGKKWLEHSIELST